MSGERRRPMNDRERKARRLVRALGPVAVDPVARREARDAFLAAAPRAEAPRAEAPRALDAAPRSRPRPLPRRPRRSRPAPPPAPTLSRRSIVAGAALAAGLLVLLGLRVFGEDWSWQAVAGSEGHVLVDGVRTPVAELGTLAPGTILQTDGDTELSLISDRRAMLVLTPGTRIRLPAARWLGGAQHAEVDAGELRISTGPDFPGETLKVHTAHSTVTVVGTTLAVVRNPDGTCVCVYEGTVEMDEDGRSTRVPEGRRRLVFADQRAPKVEPLEAMESMKLQMLDDQTERDLR